MKSASKNAEVPATHDPELPQMLRVRAIKNGVYGHGDKGAIYRYGRTDSYAGDVFTLTPREVFVTDVKGKVVIDPATRKPMTRISSIEEQFAEEWMEVVPDEAERISGPQDAVNREIGELNAAGTQRS